MPVILIFFETAFTIFTYFLVSVAIPLIRINKFKAVLSAFRIDLVFPFTVITLVPFFTTTPSLTRFFESHLQISNIVLASSSPATTALSDLQIINAEDFRSLSTTYSLVRSPVAISSLRNLMRDSRKLKY